MGTSTETECAGVESDVAYWLPDGGHGDRPGVGLAAEPHVEHSRHAGIAGAFHEVVLGPLAEEEVRMGVDHRRASGLDLGEERRHALAPLAAGAGAELGQGARVLAQRREQAV